jgi:hypothetical protein
MKSIVFAMPVALLLSLCLGGNNSKYADEKALDSSSVAYGNTNGQMQNIGDDNKKDQKNPAAPLAANPDWDKKIVKTADLNLEVKDFATFTRRLHQAVKQSGGYIAQEEQTQSPTAITNSMTIKVPVAYFDDLLMELPADSDRLVDKKISTQDVTMEAVDTKSRLETKREVRERYLELLRQAHTTTDILTAQNEINNIQQEMDQASGRIAWLGHSAAYSTINLKFYQVLAPGVPEDHSPSFYRRLADALGDGWEGLSSLLLGLLRGWPLLIGIGIVGYWVRKTIRGAKVKTAMVRPREEASE